MKKLIWSPTQDQRVILEQNVKIQDIYVWTRFVWLKMVTGSCEHGKPNKPSSDSMRAREILHHLNYYQLLGKDLFPESEDNKEHIYFNL